MKKLLPILFILIITSCSKEIQLDQLVERNGLSYEVNNEEPFTGSTLSFHPNGQLESRIEYKNGLRDGLSETFNENGQILESENYKENILNGLYERFHENGQLRVKVIFKNELPIDGQVESFFENGVLMSRKTYKEGKLTGLSETYFITGKVKTRGFYNNGLQGSYKNYYESGGLKTVTNYEDNLKDGLSLNYSENGNLKFLNNYKNGKEVGYQVFFETNDRPEEIYFNNNSGEKHGWWVQVITNKDGSKYITTGLCVLNGIPVSSESRIPKDDKTCDGLSTDQFIDRFMETTLPTNSVE
jgi:antitoxin component YwqK of YwqJK toxin-antitoxin module